MRGLGAEAARRGARPGGVAVNNPGEERTGGGAAGPDCGAGGGEGGAEGCGGGVEERGEEEGWGGGWWGYVGKRGDGKGGEEGREKGEEGGFGLCYFTKIPRIGAIIHVLNFDLVSVGRD